MTSYCQHPEQITNADLYQLQFTISNWFLIDSDQSSMLWALWNMNNWLSKRRGRRRRRRIIAETDILWTQHTSELGGILSIDIFVSQYLFYGDFYLFFPGSSLIHGEDYEDAVCLNSIKSSLSHGEVYEDAVCLNSIESSLSQNKHESADHEECESNEEDKPVVVSKTLDYLYIVQ